MNELTIQKQAYELSPVDIERLKEVGRVANIFADNAVFTRHMDQLTKSSSTAVKHDLKLFASYLNATDAIKMKFTFETLLSGPQVWQYMTHGLVIGFREYQLKAGYSIASINRQLSTIRKFVELTFQVGMIDATTKDLIMLVKGIQPKQGRNIDDKRQQTRISRPNAKKAKTVLILDEHARLLKTEHADTPQGRKDRALMCILIDLGLRASEVVNLTAADIDMNNETIRVYRIKTNTDTNLNMTRDVRTALRLYGVPDKGKLFDMSTVAVSERVRYLGVRYGYYNEVEVTDGRYQSGKAIKKHGTLSSHDLRHYLATKLSRQGVDAHSLMETMGWKSLTTAQHYIEGSKIANKKAVAIIDAE